jgi:hypothetical protein
MKQKHNHFTKARILNKRRVLNNTQIIEAIKSNNDDHLRSVFADAILTDINLTFLSELAKSCITLEVVAVHYCKTCDCQEIFFRVISNNPIWSTHVLQFDVSIDDNALMMICGIAVYEASGTSSQDNSIASGGELVVGEDEGFHDVKVTLRVPCRGNRFRS